MIQIDRNEMARLETVTGAAGSSFGAALVRLACVVIALAAPACGEERDPIQVEGAIVTVTNSSSDEWQDVEVWVNDHYRATADSVPAGGRLDVPLRNMVTGFGQRYDPRRQPVSGIEVTARSTGGDVRLVWGAGRRR
jgi:hypothetical protein